jgi:hypothetical protein
VRVDFERQGDEEIIANIRQPSNAANHLEAFGVTWALPYIFRVKHRRCYVRQAA